MKLAKRGGIGGGKLALAAWLFAACGVMAETPDRFIHYVEATGTQSVDVDVRARYGTKMEANIEWMALADMSVLDARADASTDSRVYFAHSGGTG